MFERFIAVCKEDGFGLESALLQQLKSGGIKANFSDLRADNAGIYFTFPNEKTQKVMLYQANIQESTFRIQGDPYVHLCGCPVALANFKNPDFLAVIAFELRFFLSISSQKVQMKFFYDKPLQLCKECVQMTRFNGDLRGFLGF